jgi:hypothetical protein
MGTKHNRSICVVAAPVLLGLENWSGSGTRPRDTCVVRERTKYEVDNLHYMPKNTSIQLQSARVFYQQTQA